MPTYEYMTLYITVQPQTDDGNGPQLIYSLAHADGTVVKGAESASTVAEAFAGYVSAGWTLIALYLIEEASDKLVYEARLKRNVS